MLLDSRQLLQYALWILKGDSVDSEVVTAWWGEVVICHTATGGDYAFVACTETAAAYGRDVPLGLVSETCKDSLVARRPSLL